MTPRVSRIGGADLGDVFALDENLFPGEAPPEGQDGSMWWAVKDGGRVVAYAGAYVWTPERTLVLHRCGVAPSHRGRGLQRRLIRTRCAAGRRLGMREAWTHTWYGSIVSMNNLIRSGFTLWHPYHWSGADPLSKTDGPFLFWRKMLK